MIYNNSHKQLIHFLIILFFLFLSSVYHAQDSTNTTEKYVSIEGQIYPSFNADQYRPKLKLRYFLNEKSALRFNINVNRQSDYFEIREINGNGVGSVERISALHHFSFGYEGYKKMKNTGIYTGIEGIVGFGRNDEYGSRTDSLIFIPDQNYNIKRPVRQFGIRLLCGIDQYLTPNLFIGTEMGIQFIQTNYLDGSYQVLDQSSQTSSDVTSIIPKSNEQAFSIGGVGCLRIGWVF